MESAGAKLIDREAIAAIMGMPLEAVRADITMQEFIEATRELLDTCEIKFP